MTEKANQITGRTGGAPRYYEQQWPFRFLLDGPLSLDLMIQTLQAKLDALREMCAAGVQLTNVVYAPGCDLFPELDRVVLTTCDPIVAQRFDFEPVYEGDADDELDPTPS